MGWLKHAFAIDDPEAIVVTDEQQALVDRLATALLARGLGTPALLFLELSRPLGFLGSQALHCFEPFIRTITDSDSSRSFALFLEKRGSIEFLCRRIEALREQGRRVDCSPPGNDLKSAVDESVE